VYIGDLKQYLLKLDQRSMPVDHQSISKLDNNSTSPRSAIYSNGSEYLPGIDW